MGIKVARGRPAGVLLAALLLGGPAPSGAETGVSAEPGLFDADSTLKLALEAPWRSLLREREDRPTVAGRLVSADARGARIELDARIRARGKWRLQNCSLPPLTIELPADQIASTPFAGQTVLHASTACRSGKKWEQHLLEEYLIYRMYRILTDASLGARLVEVEYRDTEGRKPPPPGHLFLVEDLGLAAERLGRRWVDQPSIPLGALDPDAAALFGLFQFMIGHTDWSVLRGAPGERCCHNAALLAPPDAQDGLLLVPFDFDASGLVDTGEIPPDESLPIRTVRQRFYRGLCAHNDRLEGAIAAVRRSRSALRSLWDTQTLLAPRTRDRALRYLDDFYRILDDPKRLQADVLGQCRG